MVEQKNSEDLHRLVEITQSGNYQDALKLGLDLLKKNGKNSILLNTLGIAFRRIGDIDKATCTRVHIAWDWIPIGVMSLQFMVIALVLMFIETGDNQNIVDTCIRTCAN